MLIDACRALSWLLVALMCEYKGIMLRLSCAMVCGDKDVGKRSDGFLMATWDNRYYVY